MTTTATSDLEISPNRYYTPEEAATLLHVSRESVRRLLKSGTTQGVRIGRSWRILGRDLLGLRNTNSSEAVFERIWDNEEDAVYDGL